MYTNQRESYRQAFYEAWHKYQQQVSLTPVEAQIVEIILVHPEYHALLRDEAACQSQEFALEENPFMHMSLHVALREQIRLNRPEGITAIHQQLGSQYSDPHQIEHAMMTCLAQILWQSQQNGEPPEEINYMNELKSLL